MQSDSQDPSSAQKFWRGTPVRWPSLSGTLSFEKDDTSTHLRYYEHDDGRYSYSIGEGNTKRTCGPLYLEQLCHGDELQYAIYHKVMGEYAEPPPKDDTFTYKHTHQNGMVDERTVKLYRELGSGFYSFASIGKDETWNVYDQSLECIQSGEYGKDFTEAFNDFLSTKASKAIDITNDRGRREPCR